MIAIGVVSLEDDILSALGLETGGCVWSYGLDPAIERVGRIRHACSMPALRLF